MKIGEGLLVLESVLLVATVIMLIYSLYEGKRRDQLLREVGRATKVLTRQEYFLSIMDAMLDAKQEIIGCITGTPPSGDDVRMTRHISDAIEDVTRKGVKVRYLLPKFLTGCRSAFYTQRQARKCASAVVLWCTIRGIS